MSEQNSDVDRSARGLYHAMSGLAGPLSSGVSAPLDFTAAPRAAGEMRSVLILGAGVGGLTAAYELSRLGYRCTVLEPQLRTGGRNRTARGGDELHELDDTGAPVLTHTVDFDPGLYLNLGPGRIPYHHRRVLRYCSELRVELEPYVMETTANLLHRAGHTPPGAPWRNRRIANDTRGHIAALLSATLDEDDEQSELLRNLLRKFGDLDEEGRYEGSTRSGYAEPVDVHDFPTPAAPPLALADLVASEFWDYPFYQPVDHLWQATMFQPVGGMDKIVEALTKTITGRYDVAVELGAKVTGIELTDNGVEVKYVQRGQTRTETADLCVSNIPLPVLKDLTLTGFSPEFRHSVGLVGFAPTCKVGWQANRRFWEDDRNQIYGGISWTDHPITQVWYPSNDYFSGTGTLTGAYNFGENALSLGKREPADRLRFALEGAAQLHREFNDRGTVPSELGVSIAWHKVPHQLGGWADWDPSDSDHMVAYKQLLEPEGNGSFYVVGDQASPLPGWQEGAMMSAQYVVAQVLGLLPRTAPDTVQVPDATFLTQGLV